MRTLSFAALPLIAALAISPAALATTPSKTAAVVAIKQSVEKASGRKVWTSGKLSCIQPGGSPSIFFCDSPLLHSIVVFRDGAAFINLLACKTSGTTEATACK